MPENDPDRAEYWKQPFVKYDSVGRIDQPGNCDECQGWGDWYTEQRMGQDGDEVLVRTECTRCYGTGWVDETNAD